MLATVMNGKPRGHDRDRLVARFRQMKEGDEVEHDELAALIDVADFRNGPGQNRYRSLVKLARDTFAKETGVYLQSAHGKGYKYPTGIAQVNSGLRGMRGAARSMARQAYKVAAVSDARLPDDTRRQIRDDVRSRLNYLAELARTEHKALEARVGIPEVRPQFPRGT